MMAVTIHYRGVGSEQRQLLAVPAAGSYLFGPGAERRLWQASAVVFDGEGVDVYAIEVSPLLAGELQAQWKTWGEGDEVLTEDADSR
jgi:hypothetical protein